MDQISRPLDPQAIKASDQRIYGAHVKDPRPNPLYDVFGKRKPLSATDPSQENLRQEWRGYYLNSKKTKSEDVRPADAGLASVLDSKHTVVKVAAAKLASKRTKDVGNPVCACTQQHWISVVLRPKPDLKKRPPYWESKSVEDPGPNLYSYEVFRAEITDGHRESYLDTKGVAIYDGIPAGRCEFEFAFFCREIELYFDSQLRHK